MHYYSPLQASLNQALKYAQLWFYNPDHICHKKNKELNWAILDQVTALLRDTSPFIQVYETAWEQLEAAAAHFTPVNVVLNIVDVARAARRH
jgi:hypothetical protein